MKSNNLTIYKARRYIYICYHFTDTTASTLTRHSAETMTLVIRKVRTRWTTFSHFNFRRLSQEELLR